jgi:hypothetical protein
LTYEDLFHFIADIQPSMPKCGLPVLMQLISKALKEGSPTVAMSDGEMALRANISRDAVRVAARALSAIIAIDGGKGTMRKWTLPAKWFFQQRPLFAVPEISTDSSYLPGNQAGGRRVTRQPWASFQASTCLETRQPPDELPGKVDELPGNLAWLPGTTCLETRQLSTHNQQLTDNADPIRSDQIAFSKRENTDRFNQIVCADLLKFEQLEDAAELKENLRAYMRDVGRRDPDSIELGNIVLARCLACASLGELLSLLTTLRKKCTVPGASYAWFVTVFAHRICKIPAKVLQAGFDQQRLRKQAQREMESQFAPDLLQQVLPNVRTMRTKVN